jgi:transposase InsO family protein
MHCHANAALTPKRRAQVFEAVEAGMTVTAACLAFRVSRRFYYRWLRRWRERGSAGLVDASSRPHASPGRIPVMQEAAIAALRQRTGWGADRLGAFLGLPPATCHRVLRRQGLIARRTPAEPVVRYEHEHPGDLVHVDTKKLGRIVGGPGHRATGDRTRRSRGVGWEILHVAIDDASRLVYAEILADETGDTAAAFTLRAVAWFASEGVTVRRVLSDNGSPYVSRAFAAALRYLGLKHSRTRPYRPRTNGKAERWIRTVLSECLYREVFASSAQRRLALARFIGYYNGVRPHLGIGGRTPRQRLSEKLAA